MHEVAVIALVHQEGRADRLLTFAFHRLAGHVVDLHLVAPHDRPVAVLEIGDRVGEGGQRDRIGPQIHLAVAMADRERRSVAGADDEVFVALEHDGERERAFKPFQRAVGGIDRTGAAANLARHQMRYDLGVGLRGKFVAIG